MATFGQMKTWVSRRLLDPSNTSISRDDVGEAINASLAFWKNKRFWFNEIADEATVTALDPVIPLPADFLAPSIPEAFWLQYPGDAGGIRYKLVKGAIPTYNENYVTNAYNIPRIYARLASGEYHMFPIPQQNYRLFRYYLRDYPEFSSDADTNVFSINAANCLQYTALAYCYRDFKQDHALYDKHMQQALKEYESLSDTTDLDNATGSLSISSYLFS